MTTKTDAEKYNELLDATTRLLISIRQTINHPEYHKVWKLYETHGFKYEGPDYAAQAAACYDVIVNHAAAEVEAADATLPLFREQTA